MAELVEKFFREDLTEAEEQALADLFASSEEVAGEFLAIAERNYARYGLPQPSWPETLGPPIGAAGAGFAPWAWMVALAILGGTAFWGWQQWRPLQAAGTQEDVLSNTVPAQKVPEPGTKPERALPAKQRDLGEVSGSTRGSAGMTLEEELQRDLAEGAKGAIPVSKKAHPETGRPSGAMTPVNLAEAPGRTFSDIAVKVSRKEPGPVSVRVLDMSGLEVAPLYTGNLDVGQWVFEWDGRLPDGNKASPGIYQVEVKSGSYRGSKNIRIR